MFMRYLRAPLLLLGLAAFVAGCDITDLDINTDPNAATSAPPNLLFPTVLVNIASNRAMEISPTTTMFAQIWSANGSTGVFYTPERYTVSPNTTNNVWLSFFSTSLRNLSLTTRDALAATPAPQLNTAAQAQIMAAYIFLTATQLWETIPYTEATNGTAFPNPKSDPQEVVLRGLVLKLDSAVAQINAAAQDTVIARLDPQGRGAITTGDLVYRGNMQSWVRFANSLKLRTLMLIRNKDTGVDAQIRALLAQPLIRTNAQEAVVPFFTTAGNENNVWKLNDLFGGFTDAKNGNGFLFAGKPLVDLMTELGDPRLDTYFELPVAWCEDPVDYASDVHVGQEAGVQNYCEPVSMVHQNIIRRDWPSRMVTAAEVWLFEAEFLASTGNLADAYTSYRTGVQLALDYFDGKPGAIAPTAKQAYLVGLPASFTSQQQALEAIWAQEYIEVFDRAPENWTHWRRTKSPELPLAVQAVLPNIIRRFPFSIAEETSNPNAPKPVAFDQPMWFEK